MSRIRHLDFSNVQLYAVTPSQMESTLLLRKVDGVLSGGVDALQLRLSGRTDREILSLGREIRKKCEEAGTLFIVNNRPDIALLLEADGIHVGHNDLPVAEVRKLIGHRKIIGVSTHSLPQAIEAQRAGADYISCGPIWNTPTKPEYPAVGLGLIGLYKAAIRIPFVAIGGIDEKNIDDVLKAGATKVAIVRSLFDSSNPHATTSEFVKKIGMTSQFFVGQA